MAIQISWLKQSYDNLCSKEHRSSNCLSFLLHSCKVSRRTTVEGNF